MTAKNKYDVILEKVGNQPLKTTKALCEALGLGLAVVKGMVDKPPVTIAYGIDSIKAFDLKKQLDELGNIVSVPGLKIEEESSVPANETTFNKSAASVDDAFDAIFGAGSAQKATPPIKIKSVTNAKVKATVREFFAKENPKETEKKNMASANNDFDAIFGNADLKRE